MCGGRGGSSRHPAYSDAVNVLDLLTRQWNSVASMSERRFSAVSAGFGGCVYVCGGANDDYLTSAERFDTRVGGWKTLSPMSTRRFGAAAATLGRCLYIIGGCNEDNVKSDERGAELLTSTERLNSSTGQWEDLPDMAVARARGYFEQPQATVIAVEECLYVCGGEDDGEASVVECFDSAVDPSVWQWRSLPQLMERRCRAAMVACRGCVYVCGGEDPDEPGLLLSSVERFDPNNPGQWKSIHDMSTPREGFAAVPLGDCIYVFGGEINADAFPEYFDLEKNEWENISSMGRGDGYRAGFVVSLGF